MTELTDNKKVELNGEWVGGPANNLEGTPSSEAIQAYSKQAAENLRTAFQTLSEELSKAGYSNAKVNELPVAGAIGLDFVQPSIPEDILPASLINIQLYRGLYDSNPKVIQIASWEGDNYIGPAASAETLIGRIREKLGSIPQEESPANEEGDEEAIDWENWEVRQELTLKDVLTTEVLIPEKHTGLVIEGTTILAKKKDGTKTPVVEIKLDNLPQWDRIVDDGFVADLKEKVSKALDKAYRTKRIQEVIPVRISPTR